MSSKRLQAVDATADGTGAEENRLTIEELAAETGMTVRNIRSHRARDLLPAPEVRDRVGYYGAEHVARLRLIQELQAEGFNLAGIKRLLEQTRDQPEKLLDLKHVIGLPFESEQVQVLTLSELAERFGAAVGPDALARAEQLGVLSAIGDDRYEVPAPSLLDVAEEVVSRGVPLRHALAVIGKVRDACRSVSREFVKLFLDDVWKPFASDGYPQERWPEVFEAIERLRPMSSQAVLAMYQMTMTAEVETAFGKELQRMSKSKR
jgi:DNA-binding transcriptional MerR regulator